VIASDCIWLHLVASDYDPSNAAAGPLSQGTATPIAEFQSVLPLLLAKDVSFSSKEIAAGTTCWHLGILSSVIACGMLFDRLSSLLKSLLVVGGTVVTALLFFLAAELGTGASSVLFAGDAKLPLAVLLGASAAPTIYLVSATTVSRHAGSRVAPTLSATCDMAGYSGNLLLLAFGPAGEGLAGAPMLRSTGFVCLLNACCVAVLYLIEARRERAVAAAHLTEPLMARPERPTYARSGSMMMARSVLPRT
jgi:hypothetical protein